MESVNCRCVVVWLHHFHTVGCSAESLVYALYVGETTTSTQTAPNQMKMNAVIINLSDWNVWLFPSCSSAAVAWLLCHYVFYVALYVCMYITHCVWPPAQSPTLIYLSGECYRLNHLAMISHIFRLWRKNDIAYSIYVNNSLTTNERKTKQTTTPTTAKRKTINWNRCWKSFEWHKTSRKILNVICCSWK